MYALFVGLVQNMVNKVMQIPAANSRNTYNKHSSLPSQIEPPAKGYSSTLIPPPLQNNGVVAYPSISYSTNTQSNQVKGRVVGPLQKHNSSSSGKENMPQYETRKAPTKQRKRSRVLRVRQDVINQAYEDDHKKVQKTYSTDSQTGIHTTINRSVSTQSIQPGYRSGQYSSIGTIAHKSSMPQINPPTELRTFRQESEVDFADFKLLLGCVRRWRGYINEEKLKRRQDGEKLVEDLAVSIHFHEQTLLTKAFISLSRNIKVEKQLKQAFRAVKRRRDNCIKRKAFRSLKLGTRSRWTRKHLVYAAMNSWAECAKKRMFDIWLGRFKKAQTLREGKLFQFIQHPFSLRMVHLVLTQSSLSLKAHPSERDAIDRELINQVLNQCRLIIAFRVLKQELKFSDGLKRSQIRTKIVFKHFATQIRKQISLKIAKYRVDSIINDRVLKWSFEYWLNKQREARCIGAQERIAGLHRDKIQIYKVWKGLLENMQGKKLTQSQMKMSTGTRLTNLIHKSFQGWRFITLFNARHRHLSSLLQTKRTQVDRAKYFYLWISQALICSKAQRHYEGVLVKRAFDGVVGYCKGRELKRDRERQLREYFALVKEKQCFEVWREWSEVASKERKIRRTVSQIGRQTVEKRVINGWRVITQENKNVRVKIQQIQNNQNASIQEFSFQAIRQFTSQSQALKAREAQVKTIREAQTKDLLFKNWLLQYYKRFNTNKRGLLLTSNRLKVKLFTLFSVWHGKANLKIQQKSTFIRNRTLKLARQAFTSLLIYKGLKGNFRSRLHKFLRLRAKTIIKKAWKHLLAYHETKSIESKLNRVANYVYLRGFLVGAFAKLKKNMKIMRAAKYVKRQRVKAVTQNSLKVWKGEYLRCDITKKLQDRKRNQRLAICFSEIKHKAKVYKRRSEIIAKVKGKKDARQLYASIEALKNFVQVKKRSRIMVSMAMIHKKQQSLSRGFRALQFYCRVKAEMEEQDRLISRRRVKIVYMKFFGYLKQKYLKKLGRESIVDPLVRMQKHKAMMVALSALYTYAYNKSILKKRFNRLRAKQAKHSKNNIFDALVLNAHSKQSHRIHVTQALDTYLSNLARKGFYSLIKNTMLQKYSREVLRINVLNFKFRILKEWALAFDERRSMRPQFEIAERHRLQKVWKELRIGVEVSGEQRKAKEVLIERADRQYSINVEGKVFQELHYYTVLKKESKEQTRLARMVYLMTLLAQWKNHREEVKVSTVNWCKQQQFRYEHLLHSNFTLLKSIARTQLQTRLRNSYICRHLHTQRLTRYWTSLKQNVLHMSSMRHILRTRIPLFKKLRLLKPFGKWKKCLVEGRLMQTAEWFKKDIWPKHLSKQCFNALKLHYTKHQIDKTKAQTIQERHSLLVKAKLLKIMIFSMQSRLTRIQKAEKLFHFKRRKFLRLLFLALQKQCLSMKSLQTMESQADLIRYGNLLRKSLIALQRQQCREQVAKFISEKSGVTRQERAFMEWNRVFRKSLAAKRIVEKLGQVEEHTRMERGFKKLQGNMRQSIAKQVIQQQRIQRRAILFFDLLKRKMIYTRMVRGFRQQCGMNLQRNAFRALILNRDIRIQHHTQIEVQVSTLLDQSNHDLVSQSFLQLRQNALKQRLHHIANERYASTLAKKGFLSLAIYSQKQRIFKYAQLELQIRNQAKFFSLWFEAIGNKRSSELSSQVIQLNKMKRIFINWRYVMNKRVIAKLFYQNNLRQRIVPLALSALQLNAQKQSYLRHCYSEIQQNRNFSLLKDVLLRWLQHHNLSKIEFNMVRFYRFKTLKQIIHAWKDIKGENSNKRKQRMNIRRQLKRRPELSKPLFVIRNIRLYKAFQMLKIGVREQIRDVQCQTTSSFAFYLRLLKKGFGSLKFNVEKVSQERRLIIIKNLFHQRRWFNNLRKATHTVKRMRQIRTDSAIFNFLNIERKGFNMLLQHALERKQQRMKLLLANEIYFKGLAVKVLLSLKSHREDCHKTVTTTNEGGISYLLHCDISQFDQNSVTTSNPFTASNTGPTQMRTHRRGLISAMTTGVVVPDGSAMAMMRIFKIYNSISLVMPNSIKNGTQFNLKGLLYAMNLTNFAICMMLSDDTQNSYQIMREHSRVIRPEKVEEQSEKGQIMDELYQKRLLIK